MTLTTKVVNEHKHGNATIRVHGTVNQGNAKKAAEKLLKKTMNDKRKVGDVREAYCVMQWGQR